MSHKKEYEELVKDTESIMCNVVDMRKRLGATCEDYAKKSSDLRLANLTSSIDSLDLKPTLTPRMDLKELMKDCEELNALLHKDQEKKEELHENILNTSKIVDMYLTDTYRDIAKLPLNREAVMERAKAKHNTADP